MYIVYILFVLNFSDGTLNALNLGEYSTLEKCQTASRDIAVYVGNPTIDTPRSGNDDKLVHHGTFCIRVSHENK